MRDQHVTLVMATELSRLSRSLKGFCDIWQTMKAHGCQFQSLREQFDTTTAAGEMVLYSIANIAQFERKQVSERVKANFAARAGRGLLRFSAELSCKNHNQLGIFKTWMLYFMRQPAAALRSQSS